MAATAATASFIIASLGIVALFVMKWVTSRGGAPAEFSSDASLSRADDYALAIKSRITRFSVWAQTLPGVLWLIVRYSIHRGAKGFARLARMSEIAAHKLADRVSHRHRFERGTHTSEYLRQVGQTKEALRDEENRVLHQ